MTVISRLLQIVIAAAVLGAFTGIAAAQSATNLCVSVPEGTPDAAGLKALVLNEIDRHPTHISAKDGCQSYLRVELIEVGKSRYVTGRINALVPHREHVVSDLAEAVEKLLKVLLHNDPVRLRGPRKRNWLSKGLADLKRGRALFGIEIYQVGGIVDGRFDSLPGVAFVARREVERWHVGARVGVAFRTDSSNRLHQTGHVAAQAQLLYFSSDTSTTAAYAGTVVGLEHQRFRGPGTDGKRQDFAKSGLAVGGRAGVEFFRHAATRFDVFGQVMLPVFATTDPLEGVVDTYLPTATFGVGVVF